MQTKIPIAFRRTYTSLCMHVIKHEKCILEFFLQQSNKFNSPIDLHHIESSDSPAITFHAQEIYILHGKFPPLTADRRVH